MSLNPVILALIDQGLEVVQARSFPRTAEVSVEKEEKVYNLRFHIFCGGCVLREFVSYIDAYHVREINGKNWVECLEKWNRPPIELPFGPK